MWRLDRIADIVIAFTTTSGIHDTSNMTTRTKHIAHFGSSVIVHGEYGGGRGDVIGFTPYTIDIFGDVGQVQSGSVDLEGTGNPKEIVEVHVA